MILIDTNVISEPWKPEPDARVLAWIDSQAIETLFLSAITIAELRFGIASLAVGRRRQVLHDRLEGEVLPLFEGRVVTFDLPTSAVHAELMVQVRGSGNEIGVADGYIAATAARYGFLMATCHTSPFEAAGLTVINPWDFVS